MSSIVESHSVVADAEAILGRVDALEPRYVARAGIGEAFDSLLNPAGDTLIECGHVV
ncbi:MAG: hypothetical protein ABSE35_20685 [Bryobacteraceae bacterium]